MTMNNREKYIELNNKPNLTPEEEVWVGEVYTLHILQHKKQVDDFLAQEYETDTGKRMQHIKHNLKSIEIR